MNLWALKLELSSNPWAIINRGAYKPKNQKIVMKKVKFGTKEKTNKCTFCDLPGTRIRFGKEVRTLCKIHLKKLNAKHQEVQVNKDTFVKASKL